jgi:hypothetical protein
MMRRAALAAYVLAAAGCPHGKPCVFVGDATKAPEAVLIVTDGITTVDVHAGDAVPLLRPPQGGQVTYAAARVRNMSTCNVQMRGRYRDPMSGAELAFDGRTADLTVGADGWARPETSALSEFANIAPCPDYDPVRDIVDTAATLEVTVIDGDKRMITVSQPVVPRCTQADAQAQALCQCECSKLPSGTTHMCNNGVIDAGTR